MLELVSTNSSTVKKQTFLTNQNFFIMKKNIFKLLLALIFITFHSDVNAQFGTCDSPNPATLFVSNLTPNSFTFSWTAPTTNPSSSTFDWKIEDATGNILCNGNTFMNSVSSTVLLIPATTYTAFVQTNCGSGTLSPWVSINAITPTIQTGFCPNTKASVVLKNQTEVGSFLNSVQGCTVLNADITIDETGGTSIYDYSGFDDITEIKGNLVFRNAITDMSATTSLIVPFSNLEKVGGNLTFSNFSSSINPFNNLLDVGGNLTINNVAIINDAFNNLQTINGNGLYISNSTGTGTVISLFNSLTSVNNLSLIGNNFNKQSTSGIVLQGVNFLGVFVKSFSNLISIQANFEVKSNHHLTLPNFNNLLQINGSLIWDSNKFLNYDANTMKYGIWASMFPILNSVEGNFTIRLQQAFDEIKGFGNLKNIGGQFGLSHNGQLTTISGFNNLQTIGKEFILSDNISLSDISGFSRLTNILGSGGIGKQFTVTHNVLLSDCSPFCQVLRNTPNILATISNKPGGNCNDMSTIISTCSNVITAKVFLDNVDPLTKLMTNYYVENTILNFPLSDPYSIAPFNSTFVHVNNPQIASTSVNIFGKMDKDAIVDWVFLELRIGTPGSTSVVSTRAALLQRDGDIVDMDGFLPIKFDNASLNIGYYVTIRHRSHLGFRTSSLFSFSSSNFKNIALNFTNNSVPIYTTNPLPVLLNVGTLNSPVMKMRGGDANFDGSIDAFDTIIWEQQNGLFDDYTNNADYNLDGTVDAFDTIPWNINNGAFEELY
jgi:hypothetical protein